MDNRKIVLAACFAGAVLLLQAFLFRYELVAARPGGANGSFGTVYRLDHWTGQIVALSGFDADVVNTNAREVETPRPKK